jgi:hypothetical protein
MLKQASNGPRKNRSLKYKQFAKGFSFKHEFCESSKKNDLIVAETKQYLFGRGNL